MLKRNILIYWLIMLVTYIALLVFLKDRQKKFSLERLEKMVVSHGKNRPLAKSICEYTIVGNPKDVGRDYIKYEMWCDSLGNKKVLATLALEALPEKNLKGAVDEYFRVVGIERSLSLNLECKFNNNIIERGNWVYTKLTSPSNVICLSK